MATVKLNHLNKSYDRGKTWAVRNANLEIPDGEFMALLGPSGCGKSSTMRMIAGLEELTTGEIYFDDRLMNRVQPQHRNVAMVFETYALYPTLTVYENLAFPLRSAHRPEAEIKKRVKDIVEILQCEDLLSLKFGQPEQRAIAVGRSGPRADAPAQCFHHGRTDLPPGYTPAQPYAPAYQAPAHRTGLYHAVCHA
jgi:multiple sugar transport system ATP-binding protein